MTVESREWGLIQWNIWTGQKLEIPKADIFRFGLITGRAKAASLSHKYWHCETWHRTEFEIRLGIILGQVIMNLSKNSPLSTMNHHIKSYLLWPNIHEYFS
jgi:hypothetical protein